MKKSAEFEKVCERIIELDTLVKDYTAELKSLKASLIAEMKAEGLVSDVVGEFTVYLQHVAEGVVVDSAALKKAGLYEKFTKPRAAYDKVTVAKTCGSNDEGRQDA